MVELRLVGLSEDRHRLVLGDGAGQEFTVPVDDRLRTALRGDRTGLAQLEIEMDSVLRPRDIQARIRAGESPEAVAEVAQVPVDKIMGYAVPVLAERQHMADRAQRSPVRRKGGDGPGKLLGAVVSERLRSRDVDPAAASWDSWRREHGKWTVTVEHTAHGHARVATFVFDALGRYTVSDDDDARWLVGEPVSKQPAERRDHKPARRLAAVSDSADDDVLFDDDDDLTAVADAVRSEDAEPAAETAAESVPEQPQAAVDDKEPDEEEPDEEEPDEEEPRRRGRKARGRASVPSWDEIMFGRAKQ